MDVLVGAAGDRGSRPRRRVGHNSVRHGLSIGGRGGDEKRAAG